MTQQLLYGMCIVRFEQVNTLISDQTSRIKSMVGGFGDDDESDDAACPSWKGESQGHRPSSIDHFVLDVLLECLRGKMAACDQQQRRPASLVEIC